MADDSNGRLGFVPRLLATLSILALTNIGGLAIAQDVAPLSYNTEREGIVQKAEELPPDDSAQYSDPFAPFNEKALQFNLKMDDWVLRPVSTGYASVVPPPVRKSVVNFLTNANVITRVANNLLQFRFPEAASDLARFGINSTLGVAGLFDPAGAWFGLIDYPDDFGLTLRYYGVPAGPYLMLPFLGPSTVTDLVGTAADGAMNPMSYFLPWPWYITLPITVARRGLQAVNYRAEHLDQFEEADRYAIDMYGAVQDAYLQGRERKVRELREGNLAKPNIPASQWILLEAPSSKQFPAGNLSAPKGEWRLIGTYPGKLDCNSALRDRQSVNDLPPLDCVPTDSEGYAMTQGS